ncbi:hypothetical protein C8Q80DRAFT_1153070 [Daedaleopsis nitida]|nr:hypothetical protein C8Q80DRAFT_1153070 [Daedaleopsis nitida]
MNVAVQVPSGPVLCIILGLAPTWLRANKNTVVLMPPRFRSSAGTISDINIDQAASHDSNGPVLEVLQATS